MATVPSIPTPDGTLSSIQQSVDALKSSVDTINGTHTVNHMSVAPKTATSIKINAAISAVIRLNP